MKMIFIAFAAFILCCLTTVWAQNESKIKPENANSNELFAWSVALDGNTAIVGAPIISPFEIRGGTAFIYQRQGGGWQEEAKIVKRNQEAYQDFGHDVAVSGDYAIVGAPTSKTQYSIMTGAAYIFIRREGVWSEQAQLAGELYNTGSDFGQAVDIDGDYAIVGAPDYDDAMGAAYIYHRSGESWELQTRLTASTRERGDEFGFAVAISGEYAVVGAPSADKDNGLAFIFRRSGESWSETKRLISEAQTPGPAQSSGSGQASSVSPAVPGARPAQQNKIISSEDNYGYAVDIDGGLAIIGAPGHDFDQGYEHGEGTAYVINAADGSLVKKLRNQDAIDGDIITPQYAFGTSVAISGDEALVGAIGSGGPGGMTGAAYSFGNGWRQTKMYLPGGGEGELDYGRTVALSGGCSWIGAPREGWQTQQFGALYSYCGSATPGQTEAAVDLVIHRPAVFDEQERAIADDLERSMGAQTLVNLDNDDGDFAFDYDDPNGVTGGDDELVMVILRLTPNTLSAGEVSLQAASGGEHIKIWKKRTRFEEYQPGAPLTVGGDLKISGDALADTLWVEGIEAHEAPQGTILKMTYSGGEACSGDCSDEAALTILGVKAQTWKGRENGFSANGKHDSDDLDTDPNFILPAPKSNRVFSGARYPLTGQARDRVDLEVQLSAAPVEDVDFYVRAFDVDDPLEDGGEVDPNDSGASGTYAGTTISYSDEEDNRGADKAGLLLNQDAEGVAKLSFSTGNATAELTFFLSHYPGDNYRAFVCGDRDFLLTLRNRDIDDGCRIVDPRVVDQDRLGRWETKYAMDGAGKALHASNVLTVWRLLHIESDAMLDPADNAPLTGNIVNLDAAFSKIYVDATLDDGSAHLDSRLSGSVKSCGNHPPDNGRFERGTLTVAGATTIEIDGNGADYLAVSGGANIAQQPLPFTASGSDGSALSGHVTGVIQDSGWRLTLNSGGAINWTALEGGTISIGGGPAMSIVATHAAMSAVEVSELRIPFSLIDDDATTTLDFSDISTTVTAFRTAYILPVNDGGGVLANSRKSVPFVRHTPIDDPGMMAIVAGHHDSEAGESDFFWAAYVVSAFEYAPCHAYEGAIRGDGDPDHEQPVYGISPPGGTTSATSVAPGGDVSFIFLESERDGRASAARRIWRRVDHAVNVAHEIGHQFGLSHAQLGLMNGTLVDGADFRPVSLNLIRSRVKSPGN